MLIPLTLPWHESNGAVAGDGALVHLTSCGTLVILITNTGELLLYFTVIFYSYHIYIKKKKKNSVARLFLCAIFILQDYIFSGFEL